MFNKKFLHLMMATVLTCESTLDATTSSIFDKWGKMNIQEGHEVGDIQSGYIATAPSVNISLGGDSAIASTVVLDVSPPTFSAGCNGISFDGGGVIFAGLDGLSSQLEDSGKQLLWGLLLGLAYSLPTVGDVFKQIRKWIQWIQGMVADSCNMGKSVSKMVAARASSTTENDDSFYKNMRDDWDSFSSCFKGPESSPSECIDAKADSMEAANDDSTLVDTANTEYGNFINFLSTSYGVSGEILARQLKNGSETAPIAESVTVSPLSASDDEMVVLLILNLLEDTIAKVNKSTASFLQNSDEWTVIKELITTGKTTDKDKFKEFLKENDARKHGQGTINYSIEPHESSPKTAKTKFIETLLYGSNTNIKLQGFKYFRAKFTRYGNSDAEQTVAYVYEFPTSAPSDFQWNGLIEKMSRGYVSLLTNTAPKDSSGNTIKKDDGTPEDAVTATNVNIGYYGAEKYAILKRLSKLYTKGYKKEAGKYFTGLAKKASVEIVSNIIVSMATVIQKQATSSSIKTHNLGLALREMHSEIGRLKSDPDVQMVSDYHNLIKSLDATMKAADVE